MTLPETYNQPTIENLTPEDKTDGNKNERDGDIEGSTAI